MILFWGLALVLIGVALAFVLPPLLAGARPRRAAGDASPGLSLYRSRLAALEEQHRIGALADDDLAEARDELARELLGDSNGTDGAADPGARKPAPGPWLAVAVGVGLPLLSIALYQNLGTPAAVDPPRVAALGGPADGEVDVEQMVARLAERLRSEPDSSEGWLLLARSYTALERYAEAAEAYGNAHRLLGDSAPLLSDLAEAQALANGQNFLGAPAENLERALALDPEFPKALWLGAFAAAQRGDAPLAVSRWRALLARQPPDSDAARVLNELIANAGPGPGAEGGEQAAAATGGAGLTVNVILADRLAAGLDGSEQLYVFARATEGPPMPLAAVRRRVSDLPLTVTLDDSMAMAPGRKLSDFETVVVGARISLGGGAAAASGDLQGMSDPVSVAGGTVNLAITERLP